MGYADSKPVLLVSFPYSRHRKECLSEMLVTYLLVFIAF